MFTLVSLVWLRIPVSGWTVREMSGVLTDPHDPHSIDPSRLSNGINHPTNALYDIMAERWYQGIMTLLSREH